jgi:hypothetical protein
MTKVGDQISNLKMGTVILKENIISNSNANRPKKYMTKSRPESND